MKVLILGGFLGSGKTSLLVKLAKHVIGDDDSKKSKIVIIENEVGEAGVDDATLSGTGLKVKDMFAGCICCSLAGQIVPALREIEESYDPDLVIIETTGVAFPNQVKTTISSMMPDLEIRICVIVDSKRWPKIKRAMAMLLEGQMEGANAILINKIDLADEESVAMAVNDVSAINPDAPVYKVSANMDIDGKVWDEILGDD